MKDWTGSRASVFVTNGATGHSLGEREVNDYYATDPKAIDILLEVENFNGGIWECACGEGHLSKRLEQHGHFVVSTDLIDRGYGDGVRDFFNTCITWRNDTIKHIITNPPCKHAQQFVEHAIDWVPDGGKVAMFLKLTFLEGKARKELFAKYPPKKVYVFSSRISCAKNGEFEKYPSSATAYAWFVWHKGYYGDTIVKWVN